MTILRRDSGDSPFSAWIRSQPELDSRKGYDLEDIDRVHTHQYYWHQYMHGELMLIEEKQFNRDMTPAQKDTFGVVNQALKRAFGDPSFEVKRLYPGRTTKYTYFGYHLIQFEKTSPQDGGIRIDRIPVTIEEFLRFLQFDRQFITERLRFNPLTIPVEEYLLPKSKHRSRKSDGSNLPTLFNPAPMQQQDLWEVQA